MNILYRTGLVKTVHSYRLGLMGVQYIRRDKIDIRPTEGCVFLYGEMIKIVI